MKALQLLIVLLAVCHSFAAGTSQAGVWSKVYWATGHVFEKGGNERKESYQVKFAKDFSSTPQVAIALDGVDLAYDNAAVRTYASDISKSGFTITVVAPTSSNVYFASVNWIATTSDTISVNYIHKDSTTDAEVKNIATGSGERYLNLVVKHPKPLNNPGVAVAISGFRFGAGANVRLRTWTSDITGTDFKLNYGTWADTRFHGADFTIVTFETNANTYVVDDSVITPGGSGPVYTGSGARNYQTSGDVGDANSVTWVGLNHIDFINGRNYRLSQEYSRSAGTYNVNFKVWADTALWQAKDTIFVTPAEVSRWPTTWAGRFSRTYWATGHKFEKDSSKRRTELLKVTFKKAFKTVPKVAVALNGLDLAYNNAAVQLEMKEITETYFIVRVIAPKDSFVYFVGISYLATVDPTISVSTFHHDTTQDELNAVRDGDGGKYLKFAYKHPSSLNNPGVGVYLSGLAFGAGANIRLRAWAENITPSGFDLKAGTWADTILRAFDVTVVHFEKGDHQNVGEITSDKVLDGSGVREHTKSVSVYPYSQFFVGLRHVDFINNHNYRLSQKFSVKGNNFRTKFTIWADTQLWQVVDTVFFTEDHQPLAVQTQTGSWRKVYWSTGHVFESNSGSERTERYDFVFPTAFGQSPKVAVGLTGFDINYNNAAVRTKVSDVSKKGFTLTVVAPAGSLVYAVDIAWIATISGDISFQTLDVSTSSETKVAAKPEKAYGNPGAAVGISGFRFGAGANIRLRTWVDSVDKNGAQIYVGTWADTRLIGADLTVVQFEKTADQGTIGIDGSTTGTNYNGSGARSEVKTGKVPAGSKVWTPLNHIDFINGRNYRVQSTPSLKVKDLSITYNTWADTAIWLVRTTVFYTPAASQ